MPTNPFDKYDPIANNTQIAFKSGTQASLNTMIKNGGATEGTFYLTTDTHKLYVGRKNTATGVVYPEQVSRGVTVVASSSDLPIPNPSSQAQEDTVGAIEEGELYYITDSNVLAALRKKANTDPVVYEWVQINPPTGISSVETAASSTTTGDVTDVSVTTNIATAAGDKAGRFHLIAGDNIELTTGSANGNTEGTVTIAATDTTYEVATAATPSGTTDGATLGLKADGGATLDSSVTINGDGTVAVTSDGAGTITVHGPTLSSLLVENHTTDGFTISLNGTDGDGANLTTTAGRLQPVITYGQAATPEESKFAGGIAHLDIYTKNETDTAIDDAIKENLATANAMTYCGVVTSAADLRSKIVANGGAHNGDVYKVGNIAAGDGFSVGGMTVDTGDLIIVTGTEETAGANAGQILINDAPVSASTSTEAILNICELIPSGDEPELVASIITNVTGTGNTPAQFQLYDGKNSGTTNILTTQFKGNNKILVKGEETTSAAGKILTITAEHETTARNDATNGDKNNLTLVADETSTTDTLGTGKYKLFVLNGYDGLKTDIYGHVTGLQGKEITFQHNAISSFVTDYGATGQISITPSDLIGTTGVSATLKVTSNTLQVTGDNTNKELKVNLVWGTF